MTEALDVMDGMAATSMSESEPRVMLRLFICGTSPRAASSVENLRFICDNELHGAYSLEIIDVLEQPGLAEEANVLATPTLIKLLPPPLRRVIGDLSDKERLLIGLEVGHPASGSSTSADAT